MDEYDDDTDELYTAEDVEAAARIAALEEREAGTRRLLHLAALNGLRADTVLMALDGYHETRPDAPVHTVKAVDPPATDAPADPPMDDDTDDDDTDLYTPKSVRKATARAPAGGVTVQGKFYPGGEFIPADVMAQATDEEKAKVEGKPEKKLTIAERRAQRDAARGETGESKGSGSSARIQAIRDAAAEIEVTDDLIQTRGELDVDDIEDQLPSGAARDLEKYLDRQRNRWVNSELEDYDADDDIDIGNDELADEAGWSDHQIKDKANRLLAEESLDEDDHERAESIISEWYRATRLKGEDALDELADKLDEDEDYDFSDLADAVRDLKDECETDMNSERESMSDKKLAEKKEELEEKWNDDEREEEKDNWLRDYAERNPHYFDSDEGEVELDKWGKDSDGDDVFRFETEGGVKYEANVLKEESGILSLSFKDTSLSYGFEITGKGGAHEVFSKMSAAASAYVSKKNVPALYFSAAERSRASLYERLVRTVAEVNSGYAALSLVSRNGSAEFFIVKRELLNQYMPKIEERAGDDKLNTLVKARRVFELPRVTHEELEHWHTPEAWADHEPTPAEYLAAALEVARNALESGDDPQDALDRLHERAHGGDTFGKAWDHSKHPRDDRGRFVSKDAIQAAKNDPKKADELRKRVTNPEQRKNLDAAIADPDVVGTKRGLERHAAQQKRAKVDADRAKGRELRIKLADQESRGEELNADDLRAIIPHLSQMTHEELSRMRAMLSRSGASFGGARVRADRVAALTKWAEGKAEPKVPPVAGDVMNFPPTANGRSGFSLQVESVDDTHAYLKYPGADYTAVKIPRESLKQFRDDLMGVVDVPATSDIQEINAVAKGEGKLLGHGDDGMAFEAGGKIVKVSSVVPFQPTNAVGQRTPEQAMKQARRQFDTAKEMREAGIPGIMQQSVRQVGDKIFTVREKLHIPQKFTAEQLDQVRRSIDAMHAAGYALNDEIQVGIGEDGKVYHFDTGKAAKIAHKDDALDDSSRFENFAEKHGHEALPLRARAEIDVAAAEKNEAFYAKHPKGAPPHVRAYNDRARRGLAASIRVGASATEPPPGEISDYLDPSKYPTRQGYIDAEFARLKRILPDDPEELLVAQAEQWASDRWAPPKEKGKYSVGDTVKHGDTVGSFRGVHTGPDGKRYAVIAHNRGQSAVPFGEVEHATDSTPASAPVRTPDASAEGGGEPDATRRAAENLDVPHDTLTDPAKLRAHMDSKGLYERGTASTLMGVAFRDHIEDGEVDAAARLRATALASGYFVPSGGEKGEAVPFDGNLHRPLPGVKPLPGDKVRVVHPGFALKTGEGLSFEGAKGFVESANEPTGARAPARTPDAPAADPKHVARMDQAQQQAEAGHANMRADAARHNETPVGRRSPITVTENHRRRRHANALLPHWAHHTKNGRTAEAEEAARRMKANGAAELHTAGDTVPFDSLTMEAQVGVRDGQPVKVTRHGWHMPGDPGEPVARAQVEPVASAPAPAAPGGAEPPKVPPVASGAGAGDGDGADWKTYREVLRKKRDELLAEGIEPNALREAIRTLRPDQKYNVADVDTHAAADRAKHEQKNNRAANAAKRKAEAEATAKAEHERAVAEWQQRQTQRSEAERAARRTRTDVGAHEAELAKKFGGRHSKNGLTWVTTFPTAEHERQFLEARTRLAAQSAPRRSASYYNPAEAESERELEQHTRITTDADRDEARRYFVALADHFKTAAPVKTIDSLPQVYVGDDAYLPAEPVRGHEGIYSLTDRGQTTYYRKRPDGKYDQLTQFVFNG